MSLASPPNKATSEPTSSSEGPKARGDLDITFDRETRLAVVLYGGISLAVYMNGVAHELYRLVRGREVYGFLKMLTDSNVVTDVISGTSAGGLNGVFLSHVLANQEFDEEPLPFQAFSDLWRRHGAAQDLLDFDAQDPVMSLFNPRVYHYHLERAFSGKVMTAPQRGEQVAVTPEEVRKDDLPSPVDELDLFVTGTNMLGCAHTQIDALGRDENYLDYMVRFHLKLRRDRTGGALIDRINNFNGKPGVPVADALATLCRITSCIPPAFAPVEVQLGQDENERDGLLMKWAQQGGFRPSTAIQGQTHLYLSDGGSLDNRPFGPAVKEIKFRLASRPVTRKLFYVDPVAQEFAVCNFQKRPVMLPDVLVAAGSDLPRYKSIRDNTDAIRDHNFDVAAYASQLAVLELAAKKLALPAGLLEPEVLRRFRRDRFYLSQEATRELLLNKAQADSADIHSPLDRLVGEAGTYAYEAIDIAYVSRFAFYLAAKLYAQRAAVANGDAVLTTLQNAIDGVNGVIELLQAVAYPARRAASAILWDPGRKSTRDRLLDIRKAYEAELHTQSWGAVAAYLDDRKPLLPYDAILRGIKALKLDAKPGEADAQPALTTIADRLRDFAIHTAELGDHRAAIEQFEALDFALMPFHARNPNLEAEQVSPVLLGADRVAGYAPKESARRKLAGDDFYAFAAFFRQSWRSNDLLWGRLDAAQNLIDSLVDRESIGRFKEFLERNRTEIEKRVPPNPAQPGFDFGKFLEIELPRTHSGLCAEPALGSEAYSRLVADFKDAKEFLEALVTGTPDYTTGLPALKNLLASEARLSIIEADLMTAYGDQQEDNKGNPEALAKLGKSIAQIETDIRSGVPTCWALHQAMHQYHYPPADPMSTLPTAEKKKMANKTAQNLFRHTAFFPSPKLPEPREGEMLRKKVSVLDPVRNVLMSTKWLRRGLVASSIGSALAACFLVLYAFLDRPDLFRWVAGFGGGTVLFIAAIVIWASFKFARWVAPWIVLPAKPNAQ